MNKLLLGMTLAVAALASNNPKDYDDQVTVAGLDGNWQGVSGEDNGQPLPAAQVKGGQLSFKGQHATLLDMGKQLQNIAVRVDPTRRPAHLDLTLLDGLGKGETLHMIYSLEGDVLKIALYTNDHGKRPTEFKTGPGSNVRILVLKRAGK